MLTVLQIPGLQGAGFLSSGFPKIKLKKIFTTPIKTFVLESWKYFKAEKISQSTHVFNCQRVKLDPGLDLHVSIKLRVCVNVKRACQ